MAIPPVNLASSRSFVPTNIHIIALNQNHFVLLVKKGRDENAVTPKSGRGRSECLPRLSNLTVEAIDICQDWLPHIRRVRKNAGGHGLANSGQKSAGLICHSGRRHLSNAEN